MGMVAYLRLWISLEFFYHQSLALSKTPRPQKTSPKIISIESESDYWQLDQVVKILLDGGVGIIPTDTCYCFVTPISSRDGIERLMHLKNAKDMKKPLSILCNGLSMISAYTSGICDSRWAFKLFKATLPGPYTYILPSSHDVPKLVVEHGKHTKRFKRKQIGVRVPDDAVCSAILSSLDVPLLCGSVPESAEERVNILSADTINGEEVDDEDEYDTVHSSSSTTPSLHNFDYMSDMWSASWFGQVDFIVESGPRGTLGAESLSTVVDLSTGDVPVVLRRGKGGHDFSGLSLTDP